MLIAIILTLFTTIYCLAVFVVGFLISRRQKVRLTKQPFVSIIIAARNEAKRIKPALDSLEKLNYPQNLHEVIWVDDNSNDATVEIIKTYTARLQNWRLIKLQDIDKNYQGKKMALHQAIIKSKGEIILTTDADCRVQPGWIQAMISSFDENTTMVLGHSLLEKRKDPLDILLRFDNLFSGIMVAAPTMGGYPISSVGRNMAYRKDAYLESGGYSKLLRFKSGDDVHLTELFRQKTKGKINFCSLSQSYTYTQRPDKSGEIIHQQIRKNSKLLHKSFQSIILTIFLFLYHAGLAVFPFLFPAFLDLWILLLTLKLGSEFIVLNIAARKFNEAGLSPFIPFLQIVYPLYVTLLAIAGSFQVFKWKNR